MASCKSEPPPILRVSLLAPSDDGRVAGGDDFIANLWKVHLRVKEEGYVQVRVLGPSFGLCH